MRFRYQHNSTTVGLAWSYETDMQSEKMAVEYGSKIAQHFACCRTFIGLLVFNMDQQRLVAEITLRPVEAVVSMS